MSKLVFAYPGDLETPTGGYGYDRRVIAGLRGLGWQVDLMSLGTGFPNPSPETLGAAQRMLEALPAGSLVVVDGLAFGVMAEASEAVAAQLKLVALVHHPLCRENGLDPAQAQALLESERLALQYSWHVIVTSPATAEQVSELFNVPQDKLTVILPGTERPDPVDRTPAETLTLLSVGTVVPRKGYDLLLEALAGLSDLKWRLDIVGGLDSDPDCHRALVSQSHRLGLDSRITFHGALPSDQLTAFYQNADLFALASRYEGYGMAYTEALAHGLPVIGSGAGAVKDTLPDEAAIYCGTEDVARLRNALQLLISDSRTRSKMTEAAKKAALSFPSWQDAAERFACVLKEVQE
ncbi:MAG: glycosyltransferase family 4 protein [Roseibium sp.]|uniref:glycosyltransferase family 4 protein n=1 Tax=Roseibium sp. TaxID=1936156 RepID=UPI0026381880|nr:glycosyltransferase family 4 protein [Roseibium sp.]MCV0425738.1 glycosyltransferase family 4 protein [Roseibium sp.]